MLIAENIERRGEAESDPVRKGRIADFLKQYWQVRVGKPRQSGMAKTIDDVARFINEDKRTLNVYSNSTP